MNRAPGPSCPSNQPQPCNIVGVVCLDDWLVVVVRSIAVVVTQFTKTQPLTETLISPAGALVVPKFGQTARNTVGPVRPCRQIWGALYADSSSSQSAKHSSASVSMQAQLAIALAIVASLVTSCRAAEYCSSEDVPLWQAYIMEATWGNSSQVGRPCPTGDMSDSQGNIYRYLLLHVFAGRLMGS